MRRLHTVRDLQAWSDAERAAGRRVALVPTMGALHAGHLALVEEARRRADRVVVSIFVNPTQFGPNEDLARYPRTLEQDLAACCEAGADVAFLPDESEVYPPGSQTWVEVEELSKPLCGRSRSGHFRGVATVVTKLLLAAKPHVAVFGEKDFQQLLVIRRGRPGPLESQRVPRRGHAPRGAGSGARSRCGGRGVSGRRAAERGAARAGPTRAREGAPGPDRLRRAP
jgi:pantoate--beta-alanine ligase